jgi:hypothetical protein
MGVHQQNPNDAQTHGSARPLVTLRRIAAQRIARVLILGRFCASEVLKWPTDSRYQTSALTPSGTKSFEPVTFEQILNGQARLLNDRCRRITQTLRRTVEGLEWQ